MTNCEKEDAKERRSLDRGALGGCVLVARLTGRAGRKARPLPPAAGRMAARVGTPSRDPDGLAGAGRGPCAAEPHGGVVVASGPGTYAAKLWSD